VAQALPTITPAAVDGALKYYREHKDEVDRYIAQHEADDWG